MVRLLVFALLCATLSLTACGSATAVRQSSKKGYDYYKAQADLDVAGTPCTIRCTVRPDQPLPGQSVAHWDWDVNGGSVVSQNTDGSEIYVAMDHQGECTFQARGVDKDGRDCTTPRGHFSSRRGVNGPPVVTDFHGPEAGHDGVEADGRHYIKWGWTNAEGYDPEGDRFTFDAWGVYDGDDTDGDGLPDNLLAGKGKDGVPFTKRPDLLTVTPGFPTFFDLVVYDARELVHDTRVVVTVTDAQGASRKWGDGHVTLMK